MQPGTSSANPAKLRSYSEDGLDLITALQPKARTVVQMIQSLARQGYPRPLGDVHTRFQDLVADWYHLDEFAGDVADGFFRASRGPNRGLPLDGVVALDDGQLAQLGRLGYADRDQAMNEAHRLAAELARLRRGERVNVRDLVNGIRRAQHDPAFAVTLSQRIGVRGYVDAAAMLRSVYRQPGGAVSSEGVEALRALSGTLTTALDTLPDTPEAERHDADNAALPDGQRLSHSFVNDLTSGYRPDPSARLPFGSPANEHDLAALVGFADPPTAVAVAIANSRMRRRLAGPVDNADTDIHQPNAWGRHGGLVSAYAGMLSRNDDAAAQFLRSDGAIEGALRRHEAFYVDGGAAVGDLVESGLTHDDPSTRQQLMHRAISEVGGRGEIRGSHMVDALTAGYERNMDLIGRFENPTDYENTTNMLAELMRDDDARHRIRHATQTYLQHAAERLPGPGDARTHQLIRLGRLHQLSFEADLNVLVDDLNAAKDMAARKSKLYDFVIGNLPGDRIVSEGADLANNIVGQVTTDSGGELLAEPDSGRFRQHLRAAPEIKDAAAARLGLGNAYRPDTNAFRRGMSDVETPLREWNLPQD